MDHYADPDLSLRFYALGIVFELIAKEEQMESSVKYLCKASYIEM